MENFIINENIFFEDNNLDNLVQQLNDIFKKSKNNFFDLCKCVSSIVYYCKDNAYKAKADIYYNAYNLLALFGFSRNSVNRLVKCYEKYFQSDVGPKMASVFFPFSSSKLFELLPVDIKQIVNDINLGILKSSMTVKEIREYVKNVNNISQTDEEDKKKEKNDTDEEEDLDSEFFNPNKHYDMSFFESCNQKQLVGIAWTLQFELEKILKKR